MGAVYEAVDQRLDTTVALKETLFADERLRKQFEREARLLARLHHPALPRVSDHFSEGDGQFLVMQFIPGDDLSEKMHHKRGAFPSDQVLTWADQLLDALDYLHTQDPQIVHRDIKPQNLKLTSRGQIILLDFGLAKGQAGEISRVTTAASIFGYTPNYAPLEQIQGLGTDARSDLYALGATLYHLMTGVKPPDALTRAAALVNGQPDPLAPASVANPAVAPAIDQFLAKSMAQNRDQRYSSAAEMRKGLHATDQASTVVNRGEAQTVLFPPAGASTVATPTATIPRQQTVPAGESTVVRPMGNRRRVFAWIAPGAALLLLACGVFAIFALKSRTNNVVQVAPTPAPTETPAPSPTANPEDAAQAETPATEEATPKAEEPAPKKEKQARTETKKVTTPNAETGIEVEVQGHEQGAPGEPPIPGDPLIIRRGTRRSRTQTQVIPGGVSIRNFPDGSQLITMPDGRRIYVSPDGKRQVLSPGRPPRRPPTPTPSP